VQEALLQSGGAVTLIDIDLAKGVSWAGLANSQTELDGEIATGAEHGAFELTNDLLDPFVFGRGGWHPVSGRQAHRRP